MSLLYTLLDAGAFIAINKQLLKRFGVDAALILGELLSEHNLWEKEGRLLDGEFFFATIERLEEETLLSAYKQREALKKLENEGIIETKIIGQPSKKYFKINEENLLNSLTTELSKELDRHLIARSEKISHLGVKNFNPINTINNNINNINNINNTNNSTPLDNNINKHINNKHIIKEDNDNIEVSAPESNKKARNLSFKLSETISKLLAEYDFSEKVEDLVFSFFEERVEQGDRITNQRIRMTLDTLAKHTEAEIVNSINNSIMNGYKGIFFKEDNKPKPEHQLRDSMKDYPWADPDELDNSPYVF